MSATSKIDLIQCGDLNVHLLSDESLVSDEQISKTLHPEELQKATTINHPQKKREFNRSRWLIRQFHDEPFPFIKPSEQSLFPRPDGTVLSLSHKESLIGLVSASTSQFGSVGLDIEDLNGVKEKLAPKICRPNEIELIESLLQKTGDEDHLFKFHQILAIIFSFKESVFKACFPIGGIWFYFDDFEINDINLKEFTISGTLKKNVTKDNNLHCAEGAKLKGSFVFKKRSKDEFIISTCSLPTI